MAGKLRRYDQQMIDHDPEVAEHLLALADELLLAIGSLRREVRRAVGRPWPESRLTGSQVELLGLVRRHPSLSIEEAAAEMGLDADSISALTHQLAGRGLLDRYGDPHDRRLARLELTPAALEDVAVWRSHRTMLVSEILGTCTSTDQDALADCSRALRILTEKLHGHEPSIL